MKTISSVDIFVRPFQKAHTLDMIKINFESTYEPHEIAEDLSFITFYSEVKNGQEMLIKVIISPLEYPLLPNVYNMAFGPVLADGKIDDAVKVSHRDIDRVFSTILLFAYAYLQDRPDVTIGVDGSNDVRAYLYHRMFLTNRVYLQDYFLTIGVDWYVKLLRNGEVEQDENGEPYFKPRPEPFDYQRNATNLYRYYMFQLKPQN